MPVDTPDQTPLMQMETDNAVEHLGGCDINRDIGRKALDDAAEPDNATPAGRAQNRRVEVTVFASPVELSKEIR